MLGFELTFDSPRYLMLLWATPMLWWLSRHSLSGIGRRRHYCALLLRSLVIGLIVLAAAEVQIKRRSDRVAVMYLVDRSQSVDGHSTQKVIDYLQKSVAEQRDAQRGDRAGVIVFGRKAAVEVPPVDGDLGLQSKFEAEVDPEGTNLADALKLGQAAFPPDASKRIVVISDGNQNVGDALEHASRLAADGIGIDVIPLAQTARSDIAVEEIILPPDVRQGAPFEGRVVVQQTGPADTATASSGRLRISRVAEGRSELLSDEEVTLTDPKHIFSFRDTLQAPDFYTYDAQFVPDDGVADRTGQNNKATAFTQIRGRGRVLLLEDWTKRGQFNQLVDRLKHAELEVVVQGTDAMFSSLAELQPYDAVIMADVPRTSGEGAGRITEISDGQIEMLVRNVQQLGSGLILLGGPDSFGAGGWTNTPLEAALPVDLQVKNTKVVPVGALMLVIDKSGSMQGDKLAMSKAAAIAALKVLSDRDYLGVVAFDGEAQWIVPIQKAVQRERMAASIQRLTADGGTVMEPALVEGYRALEAAEGAAIRHVIILTDGQTQDGNFEALARRMNARGITTSCVAVGQDSARDLLGRIAGAGAGKFYFVDNPSAIPRIFMKEARRVARPLVYENAEGIDVEQVHSHAVLQGVSGAIPPITGFVLTTPKTNALVEIPVQAAQPTGRTNAILACWQYGLGRTAILTTDAGQRWSQPWLNWEGYDKFFSQMVRWTMRPTDDDPEFSLFTEARSGNIHVVVTAIDTKGEFLNFLPFTGSVIGPDMKPMAVTLEQVAPGRYTGSFPASNAGNYFLTVASPGRAALRAGVNVPYSAEFNDRETNTALLQQLAKVVPRGGSAGVVIPNALSQSAEDSVAAPSPFRSDLQAAESFEEGWPLLLFVAGCLFFADVLNRRVLLSMAWLSTFARSVRQRIRPQLATAPAADPVMARLQARKSEVRQQYTFDPPLGDSTSDLLDAIEPVPADRRGADRKTQPTIKEAEADETYTERLLKVKKQVRDAGQQ